MKSYRLNDLKDNREGHILKDVLPDKYIYVGGLAFSKPGERSHSNDGLEGKDFHVHDDYEAFIILQGKGLIEINKQTYPITTGDIIVVEPGEDHHIISNEVDLIVTLWCHAGETRNNSQIES